MPAKIESAGAIECILQAGAQVVAGAQAKLVFKCFEDAPPPFTVKIKDASGKVVLERVLRELPTGSPQSAPPLEFRVPANGEYHVHIKQLYGDVDGSARLIVS
ncbi:MAG: hypothetical protein EXR75_05010 [Myxococcales bacterium]|nr:hypothetical protein [Myxococcales bacterium]